MTFDIQKVDDSYCLTFDIGGLIVHATLTEAETLAFARKLNTELHKQCVVAK